MATVSSRAGLDGVSCPLLDPDVDREFRAIRKASGAYSARLGVFLSELDVAERAAWLRTAMAGSRILFQPWTLEVLYGVATMAPARFSMLQNTLGIPAKTLSARLKTLLKAGLLERRVTDTIPVRIDYELTKAGRATAALASPLFTHLNLQLRRPGHP